MATATSTVVVPAEWMPLAESIKADLEVILKNAVTMRAVRTDTIALLRSLDDRPVNDDGLRADGVSLLEVLIDVEHLARELDRTIRY